MADQSILREYLISLGFKVDTMGQSKFNGTVTQLDKRVLNLGRGLVGVATAAQAMVAIFANQMEKLYYASKLAETSAGNLRAVEFGAKQIGLTGDSMRQSLVNMASAIRMNPGLIGLLNSLGVRVEGRDKSDVLVDLVTELKKMPFAIGARYAEYFGISPNDLLLMQDGLDAWKEKIALQKRLAAEMGIDQEAAALAGKEYANTWGEILMRVGLFKDALSIQLLPAMKEFADVTVQVLNDWTKIVQTWKGGADFWQRIKEGLGLTKREGVVLSPESKARLGIVEPPKAIPADPTGGFKGPIDSAYERFMRFGGAKRYRSAGAGAGRGMVNPPLLGGTGEGERPEDLFSRLEQQYGLPSGLLDRIWKKESGRGRNMLSPAGARGHFQFMPKTAEEYGIAGQEDDLGASATAAARKMANLLKYYKGDLSKAAAAYNLGEGNLNSYLTGKGKYALGLPAETYDYAEAIAGKAPSINQTNNITISGVSDPKMAAAELAREQRVVNADLVRNLTPRMQ